MLYLALHAEYVGGVLQRIYGGELGVTQEIAASYASSFRMVPSAVVGARRAPLSFENEASLAMSLGPGQ